MLTLKKYKEYYNSVGENDEESKLRLEQNEKRENSVLKQYQDIAAATENAYKDSIARVDRQRAQAMQDVNALDERLARYIPEINQRAGVAGTGMSETTALQLYAAQDAQRRGVANDYDTQKNSIMQDYRKAALKLEGEKASALSDIDLLNNEILVSAAGKKESDEVAKEQTMRNNLAALGQGALDGSVPLQDYFDYYNKVLPELDPDEDLGYLQQYKNILINYAVNKELKDGSTFIINGKRYEYRDGGVFEYGDEFERFKDFFEGSMASKVTKGRVFEYKGSYFKVDEYGKIVPATEEEYKAQPPVKKTSDKLIKDIQKRTIPGS